MRSPRRAVIGFACLSMLQSGCNDSDLTAGIDGSGAPIYAEGPIEGFGSIVVNGRHYELSGASISVNDEPATSDDLAIGQVVAIEAHLAADGTRVADTVAFEANLRGPLQSVDATNGTLTVLEQAIRVGSDTTIAADAGNSLDALTVGDFVEVSGLMTADGGLAATRVVQVDDTVELRIVGRVEQLNLGSFTYSIGNLVVDYSSAGSIDGFPSGQPSNGDEVLAVGTAFGNGVLTASRLRLIEPHDSDHSEHEGHEAEVEGLITRFVSATDFDVAGRPATTTDATDYEGGSVLSLGLNVKVQIEGRFDASGTIVAEKIEIKDGGEPD